MDGREKYTFEIVTKGGEALVKTTNGITKSVAEMEKELKKADTTLKNSRKAYSEQQKEVDRLQKEYGKHNEQLDKLQNARTKDANKIREEQQAVARLKQELNQARNALNDNKKALETAEHAYNNVKRSIEDAKKAQEQLNETAKQGSQRMGDISTVMRGMPPQIQSVFSSFQNLTNTIKTLIASPLAPFLGAISAALAGLGFAIKSVNMYWERNVEGQRAARREAAYTEGAFIKFTNWMISCGEKISSVWSAGKRLFVEYASTAGKVFEVLAKYGASMGVGGLTALGGVGKWLTGFIDADSAKSFEGLAKRQQSLVDANYKNKIKEAELDNELIKLRNELYGAEGAEKEKIAAKAYEVINQKHQNTINLLKEELDLLKQRNSITGNDTKEEDKYRETELEAQIQQEKNAAEQEKRAFIRAEASGERQGESAAEKANRSKVRLAEQQRQENEYNEELKRQARDNALEVEQARIDGLEKGVDKELQQIALNYKRRMAAIADNEKQMIKAAQQQEEARWKAEHPDYEKQGLVFTPTAGLTDSQSAQIAEQQGIAASERDRNVQKVLKALQDEYAPIEQKIAEIKKKFAADRAAMYNPDKQIVVDGVPQQVLKEGFTQGNVEELDRKEQEALDAVDASVAAKSNAYKAWMNTLTTMTLDELKKAIEEAEKALEQVQSDPNADPKQVAEARARVKAAKDRLEQGAFKSDDKSIKSWQKLHKVLRDVKKDFDSIGDAIGGAAGNAIKLAGTLASSALSMVDSIKTLSQNATSAVEGTSKAASKSMSNLEKASVILTVISTAFQVFSTLASVFGGGSNVEEMNRQQDNLVTSNKNLQRSIDELKEKIVTLSGVEAKKAYSQALEETRQQERNDADKMLAEASKRDGGHTMNYKLNDDGGFRALLNQVSRITGKDIDSSQRLLGLSYEDWNKIYQYDNGRLFGQIQSAYRNAEDSHTGSGIDDMLGEFIDKYKEAYKELDDTLLESLTGGLKKGDLANEWKELLTDMDSSTKDFAESFEEKMRQAVANSLVKSKYQAQLDAITEQLAKNMEDDNLSLAEAENLRRRYNTLQDAINKEIQQRYDAAGLNNANYFTQDYSKGVGSMSEQTAEELNGRFAAIQLTSQNIYLELQGMHAKALQSLNYLQAIERNTARANDKLDQIIENTNNI